jgi:DNA mismatch repair protein MutS
MSNMSNTTAPGNTGTTMVQLTPMMEQYLRMKDKAGDALLLFRMGDFYELFQDDAIVASKALNIALTSRNKHQDEPIPMCGVPVHSIEGYIESLVEQGHKVAICEQIEDPKQAQGLVKRDIIRVITPGTIISDNALQPKENNFLASVAVDTQGASFAYIDVSTGTFAVTAWTEANWTQALEREFDRIQPRELLVPEPSPVPISLLQQPPGTFSTTFQAWEREHFRRHRAHSVLTQQFGVRTLEGFGCEDNELVIAAAGALLAYVQSTQRATLDHLQGLIFYSTSDFMVLDETTRLHLELMQSAWSQKRTGSLLDVMDMTVTAMGGRLLRQWLSQPLYVLQPLQERQEAVAELVDQSTRRARLRQALEGVADLERIVGRLSFGSVSPRDLVALRHSIDALPAVEEIVRSGQSTWFIERAVQWDRLADLETCIAQTIVDEPPASLRDGLVIRPGYHAELDALRDADASGKAWLNAFEMQERERTGINALRIGFNKVFGYYIEVRKAHAEKVPDTYIRKQTLVNAERFITPALKEHEVRMLRSGEHATRLEQELYDALRQVLLQHTVRLQQMAQLLSQLDVLSSLAELAVTRQYCRPTLDLSDRIDITDGRHAVLESTYQHERFVPNDTLLDCETNQILLLTGPNMAGKSTYMRQVALIVIMAQMGSFVPAGAAHIGLVDRVFTRVGAQDLLAKGQSTFMVEMMETANILHNVGPRSLVLLDEIGRGTSTYDGISIAWAVVEYLHQHPTAHPRTLFATHYHELTVLATSLERVHNFNAAVREWGEKVVFLRKILAGRADRSYGIQVARLAGLPRTVIERSRQLLAQFESADSGQMPSPTQTQTAARQRQLSLFESASEQLLQTLRTLSIDDLSPREALDTLAELQQRARRLP